MICLILPMWIIHASGIKAASLIRLGFLAVLPVTGFLGVIGNVSAERHRRLVERLANHIRATVP